MMDQLQGHEADIESWIKKSKTIQSLARIPGDASARKYYRVSTSSGEFIIMRMEPFSEEGNELPFLAVQRHLQENGVPVPTVFDVDPARGFVLLEDLGDTT